MYQTTLERYLHSELLSEEVCGFLVTTAVRNPDGSYEICVQANDQQGFHSWGVFHNNVQIAYSNDTNPCWTIPPVTGAAIFTVSHAFLETICDTVFFIPPFSCPQDFLSAQVQQCDLSNTVINVDPSVISAPYTITFGDGSLAEHHTAYQVPHAYPTEGMYEVCITYAAGEGLYTCCDSVRVSIPDGCLCPPNAIYLYWVEPCEWEASLIFSGLSFPAVVDFGDGTSETIYSPFVTHDFPAPGLYNICYSYESAPGDTITCCENVDIEGCCLDPSFELTPVVPSPSCFNPLYMVSHQGCANSLVTLSHLWEFSDGTSYIGETPPPHLFTNFVDTNGEVCVTHTVICCEDSASITVCQPHTPGAYLGTPNQTTNIFQILPSTGQSAEQFIHQNANGPVPLIIEGTLLIPYHVSFGPGIWNMARNAEILVRGNSFRTLFTLQGTVLRSAVRIGPPFGGCCQWKGIHSERPTYITLENVTMKDAEIALHYPTQLGVASLFPVLVLRHSTFTNNFFGVKSFREFVYFRGFLDNVFDGAPHPQLCECDAINAFDFREVGMRKVKINSLAGTSQILRYEKGFYFENSRLNAKGFDISLLKDYFPIQGQPNNPPGEAAIGIDFLWTKPAKSSLELDHIAFHDFEALNAKSVAVRDKIVFGKHSLTAIASQPLSSITTSNLAGGYEINIGHAKLNATIRDNRISTNGGPNYGFGITGRINSIDNILNVEDNTFDISSNGTSQLNGGIFLTSLTEKPQEYKITGNTIDVALPNGAGIGITNAFNSVVRRNTLTNAADITGIFLREGGSATVDCNDVRHKPIGIEVLSSRANLYGANYLRANSRDLEVRGDASGAVGSTIHWNIFRNSDLQSIFYHPFAVVGKQFHHEYNRWQVQYGTEVKQPGPLSPQNRYYYPSHHPPGTLMHPVSEPSELFEPTLGPIDTIPPSGFCTAAYDGIIQLQDSIPDQEEAWAAIVEDTAYRAGQSAAEQTFMRQEIYGLLLEHPSWVSGNTVLSDFKAAYDNDFVGLSETLQSDWQALLDSMAQHQNGLAPLYSDVDSLAALAQQWIEAMGNDTTQTDSLLALLNPVLAEADSLNQLIEQADSLFFLTVQASVGQLLVQNEALDAGPWHQWCEKRYNEIALNWLAGTEPDSTATADLRTIAKTCLADGGRSVLAARGLCEVWLKEHYGENGCQPPQSRNSVPFSQSAATSLDVVPNPAHDAVRIVTPGSTAAEDRMVQVLAMDGRLMYTATLPAGHVELNVPVASWPEGLYIARMNDGKQMLSRIFAVQHP